VPNDARTNGIVVAYRYRGAGGVFAWYGYQRVRA
jgi:hypothetical protein